VKRLVASFFVLSAGSLAAYEYADFTSDQQQMLQNGQSLVWTFEDNSTHKSFTCVAALMDTPLAEVWAFIGNKELAPSYLNGIDISKVVGREGDDLLVYQQTRPTGISKAFKYITKHHPTPFSRIEFQKVSGDLRDVEGAWHFDAVEGGKTLLVYQLHIDPGFPYPQAFVVNNQKQRLPLVMVEIRKRLAELKEKQTVAKQGQVSKLVNAAPVN
jgi:hypothetical protein